jgi:hypothetical protein
VKSPNIVYWTATGLLAAFIFMTAVPDVLKASQALEVFARLGYPVYLLPFLGTAKILGAITLVTPRLQTLKEWAYAGITFDLVGAFYSHLSVGDGPDVWVFSVVGVLLLASSYFLRRRVLTLGRVTLATAA